MPLYRRVARRGFSNYPFKKEYVVVSLASIESRFSNGDTVSIETLRGHSLIGNRDLLVKILGDGEVSKKLTVVGVRVSRSAAAKIVAAGGTVDNIAGKETAEASPEPEAKPKKVAPKTEVKAEPEKAAPKAEVKAEPKKAAPKTEVKAEPKKAAPKVEAKPKPKKAGPKAGEGEASPAKKQKAAVAKAPAKAPAESKKPAAAEAKDPEQGKASAPKKSAPKKSTPKKAESDASSDSDTAEKDSK